MEVLHRSLVEEAEISRPGALGGSLHCQSVGMIIFFLLDVSTDQLVPCRVGHKAMLSNLLLSLGFEDYPTVFDLAEVGVPLQEDLIRLGEVVVLPGGVGEGLNEVEGLSLGNSMVALKPLGESLDEYEFPRSLEGQPPDGFKCVPVDWNAIIHRDLLEPALIVDDERVLAVLSVILREEQRFVMKSRVDGQFLEAVRNFPSLGWFSGLRVDVEEGRPIADRVESTEPPHDNRLIS